MFAEEVYEIQLYRCRPRALGQ